MIYPTQGGSAAYRNSNIGGFGNVLEMAQAGFSQLGSAWGIEPQFFGYEQNSYIRDRAGESLCDDVAAGDFDYLVNLTYINLHGLRECLRGHQSSARLPTFYSQFSGGKLDQANALMPSDLRDRDYIDPLLSMLTERGFFDRTRDAGILLSADSDRPWIRQTIEGSLAAAGIETVHFGVLDGLRPETIQEVERDFRRKDLARVVALSPLSPQFASFVEANNYDYGSCELDENNEPRCPEVADPYWPHYAITSHQMPALFSSIVPPKVLANTVGLGWVPTLDVQEDKKQLPAASNRCEKYLTTEQLRSDFERFRWARLFYLQACEFLELVDQHGLLDTDNHVFDGYHSPLSLGTGTLGGRTAPTGWRTLVFEPTCDCLTYD